MAQMDTAPAAASHSTDITPKQMRSLLDRQKTAFMQEGAPAYEVRIDWTNRLIALLVDNRMKLLVRSMRITVTTAQRPRCSPTFGAS